MLITAQDERDRRETEEKTEERQKRDRRETEEKTWLIQIV
jgi:hypothetical protein